MRRPGRDQRSPEAAAYHRWYSTERWRRLRAQLLAVEPLCRVCLKAGRVTATTVADHKIPHRGDPKLFWNFDNLQGLCDIHHGEKQRVENGGPAKSAISVSGWPVD
jgi:5-methylcytosine-specific restriction endonuclease McrA